MARSLYSSLEPLETRIAPAGLLPILHPLPDIVAGIGKTGATIDLANMLSNQTFSNGTSAGFDTFVDITTNFDTAPNTPGLQAGHIVLELYDGLSPLTVQNFITYLKSPTGKTGLENTFFHRLVQGFVLQGGGYKDTNPSTHIVTGPDVHNEYNASNSLSNTAGTIAMAKTGLSPNTASSEWFINLADNSSNLNNQNGGFTVFGKVTAASMAVVNGIAALTPTDISSVTHNGALTSVPVQGGYTTASGKAPTASQLVDITSIKVIPPTQATAPGDTFSVLSDNNALVTAKVTGDTLKLAYKPGASGVANITVHVNDSAGDMATETFAVTVRPNLIVNMGADTLPSIIGSGSTGMLTAKVTNTGGGAAKGFVDVSYYLEPTSSGAVVLDPNAQLFQTFPHLPINLGSGKTASYTEKVTLPPGLTLTDAANYQVIAQVTPSASTAPSVAITELFSDDNYSLNGQSHSFEAAAKTNLVVHSMSDTLPLIVVPGDTGTAKVQLTNNTSFEAKGSVDVKLYLALATDPNNPQNTTFQTGDLQLADVTQSIDVLGGKSVVLTERLKVPSTLFNANGDVYVVFAEVTSPFSEVSITDNNAASSQEHLAYNAFGTFSLSKAQGLRQNVPLSYTDAYGNKVSLSMKGNEAGIITVEDTASTVPAILDLQTGVFSTLGAGNLLNAAVSAHVTLAGNGKPGPVLNNITATSPIGQISLGAMDVTGAIDIQAGVGSLILGNLLNDAASPVGLHTVPNTIHLGTSAYASGVLPVLKLGTVSDYSLTADSKVNSISAISWVDVQASGETISAPGLNSLTITGSTADKITGDLQANVTISASTVPTAKPGMQTAPLKNFVVNGTLLNSTVQIAGDVGSVSLGAMHNSNFLVAVSQSSGTPVLPTEGSDFTGAHKIGSFVITDAGLPAGTLGMVASTVAAAHFDSIVVNNPDSTAELGNFGFIAETIARYSDPTESVTLTNLAPGSHDQQGTYLVEVLAS